MYNTTNQISSIYQTTIKEFDENNYTKLEEGIIDMIKPLLEKIREMLKFEELLNPFTKKFITVTLDTNKKLEKLEINKKAIQAILKNEEIYTLYLALLQNKIENVKDISDYTDLCDSYLTCKDSKNYSKLITILSNFSEQAKKLENLNKKIPDIIILIEEKHIEKTIKVQAHHILKTEVKNIVEKKIVASSSCIAQHICGEASNAANSAAQEEPASHLIFFDIMRIVSQLYHTHHYKKIKKNGEKIIKNTNDTEILTQICPEECIGYKEDTRLKITPIQTLILIKELFNRYTPKHIELKQAIKDINEILATQKKRNITNTLLDIPRVGLTYFIYSYFPALPYIIIISIIMETGSEIPISDIIKTLLSPLLNSEKIDFLVTPGTFVNLKKFVLEKVSQYYFMNKYSHSTDICKIETEEQKIKSLNNKITLDEEDITQIYKDASSVAIKNNHYNLWEREKSLKLQKILEQYNTLLSYDGIKDLIQTKTYLLSTTIKKGTVFQNRDELATHIFNNAKKNILEYISQSLQRPLETINLKTRIANFLSPKIPSIVKKYFQIATSSGKYGPYQKILTQVKKVIKEMNNHTKKTQAKIILIEPKNMFKISEELEALKIRDEKHQQDMAKKDTKYQQDMATKDNTIATKDNTIAKKDAEIAKLKAMLELKTPTTSTNSLFSPGGC